MNDNKLAKTIVNVLLITIMLIWILPTIGLLITSVRPASEVSNSGWWTVLNSPLKFTQFTLENYDQVLSVNNMNIAFRNSFIIAIMGTFLPVTIASFAAFGLAKLRFRGRMVIYGIIVGLLVIPLQMTFIPILRIFNFLNISGTFVGLWIAHTGYGMPFAVFMLYNFFSNLPDDLFEAAYIDGASMWTVYYKLALPLSVPALASLIIFQFLWTWNDLLVALIYLGGTQDVAPVTVRLANMVGSYGQNWHVLTAGAFISIIVPLTLFFSLQRYFIRGILAGSVKG
ncbi:MAG TPA: carbohydrate ABC transporter permease [Halanaerobiales bacterium]|nr:carbohydrate ABC transporter permease [Halanaerobiales bacterium]